MHEESETSELVVNIPSIPALVRPEKKTRRYPRAPAAFPFPSPPPPLRPSPLQPGSFKHVLSTLCHMSALSPVLPNYFPLYYHDFRLFLKLSSMSACSYSIHHLFVLFFSVIHVYALFFLSLLYSFSSFLMFLSTSFPLHSYFSSFSFSPSC